MTAAVIPARRWILDLGAVALLLAVPIAGFRTTFEGPAYLVAAGGGAAAGLLIAAVGARFRWGVLLLAGLTALAYLLLGGALALPGTTVAAVIPTLDTLGALAVGTVTSWKQLLTTVAPLAASDGHLIVPFLLSLVAAVITASIALRASRPGWAMLPAGAFLVIGIALGTSEPAAPIAQGIVFGVVGMVWLAVRQAWAPSKDAVALGAGDTARRGAAVRRVVAGGAVVAAAAVIGVAGAGLAAPPGPRYVLRDVVIPPFDIRQYPSPLQSFRAYVRDHPEDALFTVSGLPEGARMRLATMDAYDGTVYNVSDEGAGTSSAFTQLRGNMSPNADGTPVTLRVEIGSLASVWMPDAGAVTSVTFEGERADDLRRSAHYNELTGTGVVTAKLGVGDAYLLDAVLPPERTDESLADSPFAQVRMPKQAGVPEGLSDLASEAVAEATTPIEQVRALQSTLSQDGFFSHGLEGEALSRAGHGAQRITTLLGSDQMVGDDEQYAAAMALLAGQLGIPARVVMGFYPDEDQAGDGVFTATGGTLHAWVEVAFEGAGWVPFDPTPPEDQLPNDQTTKPRADPKPQVLQPPPPPQEPVDLPPTVPDDRESEEDDDGGGLPLGAIAAIGGGLVGLIVVLAGPFVIICGIKAARRRRRREAERAADRISGGWDELVDRAADHGTPVRPGRTRIEDAGVLGAAFAEPRVAMLARRADAEVFGPADPTPDDVDEFWRQVDEIVGGMGDGRSLWGRITARLSLRSLLAGTRFAVPDRTAGRGAAPERAHRRAGSRAPASSDTASSDAARPDQENE